MIPLHRLKRYEVVTPDGVVRTVWGYLSQAIMHAKAGETVREEWTKRAVLVRR